MNFQETYSRAAYLDFFRNILLPDDFEQTDEIIPLTAQADRIKQVVKIGEVPSLDLPVFEIKHKSENDPRVTISKEAFRIIANYGKQQALILFVSTADANFRLSLITLDLKLEGKRVTKEFSNPRRYSFFLGPQCKAHTPEQYLSKRVTDLNDLKDRFSIEVVNKEFFTQIALLFTRLTGGTRKIGSKTYDEKGCLKLPDTKDETIKKEFAVRLIGRLIFCWFLKKKTSKADIPLVPADILSLDAITQSKKDPACVGGYYHGILEPLFFEILNTPVDERKKPYRNGPWKLVPFLNGGLFNPHQNDFYELAFTDRSKHINELKVPDEWLTELLDIFETYNFTIDENTPIDVELAIEPEMLGRIFENLLAEINPETGETARKATGSYYTPRPIVEYMVDESLKQYMITKTGIAEDKIGSLLSYADDDGTRFTDKQKQTLVETLHEVKIIDPACGSGAFPIGVLQKILLMLQKLDPDSSIWLQKMLSTIPDEIYRKELKKKKIPNYLHKLGIIRDCIFGVDIQPIAVEISKLRCFLSLIVDEKVGDDAPNRGIEHLPNLEFKFVCANTLLSLPKKSQSDVYKKSEFDQIMLFEAADKIDELKKLRDEYLSSYGEEKDKIIERFRKVQFEMSEHNRRMFGRAAQTAKLSQWNPFSDEASSWFDPDWMFGIKDGFDIVIANPPYYSLDTIPVAFKAYLKVTYSEVFSSQGNIYFFFIKRSFDILKHNGTLIFINENYYLKSKNAYCLRKYLLSNVSLLLLVDFRNVQLFENVNTLTVINAFKKTLPADNSVLSRTVEDSIKFLNSENITRSLLSVPNVTPQNSLTPEQWLFVSASKASFKHKIDHDSIPLIHCVDMGQGMTSGNNDIFVVSREQALSCGLEEVLLRKYVKTRDIKPYAIMHRDLFLLYVTKDMAIAEYPMTEQYLAKHKESLMQRFEMKNNPSNWFAISVERNKRFFEEYDEKVLTPLYSKGNKFAYDDCKNIIMLY